MKIILIVGPSGAGKDSLLQSAVDHYCSDNKIVFVPRYITRKPDDNENNYFVDENGFNVLKENNFFLADWGAHGNFYGVSRYEFRPQPGGVRIVSISRTVIRIVEKQFSDVHTILITAPSSTLLERIQRRRRESVAAIAGRLDRVSMETDARRLHHFDNSAPLKETIPKFLRLMDSIISPPLSLPAGTSNRHQCLTEIPLSG